MSKDFEVVVPTLEDDLRKLGLLFQIEENGDMWIYQETINDLGITHKLVAEVKDPLVFLMKLKRAASALIDNL